MHTSIIKIKLFDWMDEYLFDSKKKNNETNSKFVFNSKPLAKRPKDMKNYEITLTKKSFKAILLTISKSFIL